MTEIHLYECDNCHRTEKPGKEVVGWIAVIVARMVLPGMDKEYRGVDSKEFCSNECAEVGIPRLEIPAPLSADVKKAGRSFLEEMTSGGESTSVGPPPGQYL